MCLTHILPYFSVCFVCTFPTDFLLLSFIIQNRIASIPSRLTDIIFSPSVYSCILKTVSAVFVWDEHTLLCTIAIGKNIGSLDPEISPGVSSPFAVPCPVVLCTHVLAPFICLKRCRSLVNAPRFFSIGGFVRFSLIIWTNRLFFFLSLYSNLVRYHVSHEPELYSPPPQHGWVFSGRGGVCASPALAEFHAHGKPTLCLLK